ncbi:hypothetical protein [Nocardia vulneris]|nr:hypothetical protein [Nocardia vulneris]
MTTVAIAVAAVAVCLAMLWGEMSRESLRYTLGMSALLLAVGVACLVTGLVGALRYHTWRLSLIAPAVAILSIAYFPDSPPVASSPEDSYTHFEGPWYRFYDGF